jgi:hypothetical protein
MRLSDLIDTNEMNLLMAWNPDSDQWEEKKNLFEVNPSHKPEAVMT